MIRGRGIQGFGLATAFLIISVTASFADCTCRAQGRDLEQGQTICMATTKGFRLATCGMVLNNSSWYVSESPCVVSSRLDLLRRKERAILASMVPHDHMEPHDHAH